MKVNRLKFNFIFIMIFFLLILSSCMVSSINAPVNKLYSVEKNELITSNINDIIKKCTNMCVAIYKKESNSLSHGSGVIYKIKDSNDEKEEFNIKDINNTKNLFAYIITNKHVTEHIDPKEDQAYVRVYEHKDIDNNNMKFGFIDLKILEKKESAIYDLSLVKIKLSNENGKIITNINDLSRVDHLLKKADIPSDKMINIGEDVFSIGTPYKTMAVPSDNHDFYFICYNFVTKGHISSESYIHASGSGNSHQVYYILSTAVLNEGNSGGGMFDHTGKLIGINSMKVNLSQNDATDNRGNVNQTLGSSLPGSIPLRSGSTINEINSLYNNGF